MADLRTLIDTARMMLAEPNPTAGAGDFLIILQKMCALAIADIEELDLGWNYGEHTLTMVADQGSYERDGVELPADLHSIVGQTLYIAENGDTEITSLCGRVTWDEFKQMNADWTSTTTPRNWAWWGEKLYFVPAPDAAHTTDLEYRRVFTKPDPTYDGASWTPAAGTLTNDVFTKAFNLLLYRTCWHVATSYTASQSDAQRFGASYQQELKRHLSRVSSEKNVLRIAPHFGGPRGFHERLF